MQSPRARRVRFPASGGARARRVPRDAGPAADDAAGGAALGPRPAVVRGGRRRPGPMRVPAADRVRGVSREPTGSSPDGASWAAGRHNRRSGGTCLHLCLKRAATATMRAMTPSRLSMSSAGELFSSYDAGVGYDEMFDAAGAPGRSTVRSSTSCAPPRAGELALRQVEADKAFLTQGITFTVYGDEEGTERIFPFDLLPRIITAAEWRTLVSGPDAAPDGDQPVPQGRLPRRAHSRGGRRAARPAATAAGTSGARCAACASTATSTCRSPAATSCGSRTAGSSSSKTTCACRAACPTCSPTAR